jgi:hypothetical protein
MSRDIYKPVLPKNIQSGLQSALMSKSMIETLETVPEKYSGPNSDSDSPKVTQESVLETMQLLTTQNILVDRQMVLLRLTGNYFHSKSS